MYGLRSMMQLLYIYPQYHIRHILNGAGGEEKQAKAHLYHIIFTYIT